MKSSNSAATGRTGKECAGLPRANLVRTKQPMPGSKAAAKASSAESPPAPATANGFQAVFDLHPTPILIYDLVTLRFLEVNDAAIAQYGYSREEFRART